MSLPPIGKPRPKGEKRKKSKGKRRGGIQLPEIIQTVEESPPPQTARELGFFGVSKADQLKPEIKKLKSSISEKKALLKKLNSEIKSRKGKLTKTMEKRVKSLKKSLDKEEVRLKKLKSDIIDFGEQDKAKKLKREREILRQSRRGRKFKKKR